MKKIFASITGFLLYLFIAKPAFAEDVTVKICTDPNSNDILKAVCGFTAEKSGQLIGNVIIAIIIVAVVIALIYLIVGGVRWITSGGDKQAVQNARSHIIAAIVGLIIALLSYFIISFVLRIFGIDNIASITIPTLIRP